MRLWSLVRPGTRSSSRSTTFHRPRPKRTTMVKSCISSYLHDSHVVVVSSMGLALAPEGDSSAWHRVELKALSGPPGRFRRMDPNGRIAVVTGAAGGIGGALVRALAGAGARAVIAADLESPVLGGGSAEVVSRRLDVTDEGATVALVAEGEASIGPVGLWVANAGLGGGAGPDTPDAT